MPRPAALPRSPDKVLDFSTTDMEENKREGRKNR